MSKDIKKVDASKENCLKVKNSLAAYSGNGDDTVSITRDTLFGLINFLNAAERRLPSQKAIDRDRAKKRKTGKRTGALRTSRTKKKPDEKPVTPPEDIGMIGTPDALSQIEYISDPLPNTESLGRYEHASNVTELASV